MTFVNDSQIYLAKIFRHTALPDLAIYRQIGEIAKSPNIYIAKDYQETFAKLLEIFWKSFIVKSILSFVNDFTIDRSEFWQKVQLFYEITW